jgi:hypothetical protein
MGGMCPALNFKASLVTNVKPEDVIYSAIDDEEDDDDNDEDEDDDADGGFGPQLGAG